MYEARCEGVGPDQADSLNLIFVRWRKIENDLFKKRKNSFDLSKVADIYDCVVYVRAALFAMKKSSSANDVGSSLRVVSCRVVLCIYVPAQRSFATNHFLTGMLCCCLCGCFCQV